MSIIVKKQKPSEWKINLARKYKVRPKIVSLNFKGDVTVAELVEVLATLNQDAIIEPGDDGLVVGEHEVKELTDSERRRIASKHTH